MMKWAARTPQGRPILGFRLNKRNIDGMQVGRPIIARCNVGGTEVEIVMHFGEGDEDLTEAVGKVLKVPPIPQTS